MHGQNLTSRNGSLVAFELLRIGLDTQLRPYYEARPSGGQATRFELAEHDEHRCSFVNAAHDFPKRITYDASSQDTLAVSAVGTGEDGAERTEAWTLKRVE